MSAAKRAGWLEELEKVMGAEFRPVGERLTPWAFGDYGTEYFSAKREAAVVDLSARDFVRVEGPDSSSYLQSLVSQDLARVSESGAAYSFLLEPRGKVASFFRIWMLGDGLYLLETDPGYGKALVDALGRFKVRVEVDIWEEQESALLALTGELAEELGAKAGLGDLPVREGDVRIVAGARVVREPRNPGIFAILFTREEGRERVCEVWRACVESGFQPVGWQVWDAIRVERGWPCLGRELDSSVIPQETGLVELAVDFEKGCYLGQELVARIDSRGHVNRRLRGLVISENLLPPPGAEVTSRVGDGRRGLGEVTSVAESLDLAAPICLAYLRREAEKGSDVVVRWRSEATDREVSGRVVDLPFAV